MLRNVADHVERGVWVSDALHHAEVDVPANWFDRLAAAERAGRLPIALDQILREERERRSGDPSRRPFVRVYSILLLIMIPGISSLISFFVLPKFSQILKDFKLPQPFVMKLMIALSSSVAPIVMALGVLLFILASQVAIGEIRQSRPRRWTRLFKGLVDRVRWVLPIVGRLDRDRGWADVCQTVAEGLDAQRPMNLVVADARQPHLNVMLTQRVNVWMEGLEQGLSPGEAAAAARCPNLISGMLGRERDVPDLVATLRFLERYYHSRFSRLQLVLRESAIPLLALIGGGCVLIVALTIFQPIVTMLREVSVYWPRV
jgi:type II secretory pathway component PulF